MLAPLASWLGSDPEHTVQTTPGSGSFFSAGKGKGGAAWRDKRHRPKPHGCDGHAGRIATYATRTGVLKNAIANRSGVITRSAPQNGFAW
jgi:hypothetical protein